jgi:hypothetical protein
MSDEELVKLIGENLMNSGGPAMVAAAAACILNSSEAADADEVRQLAERLGRALDGTDFKLQTIALFTLLVGGHMKQAESDEGYKGLCEFVKTGLQKVLGKTPPVGRDPMFG